MDFERVPLKLEKVFERRYSNVLVEKLIEIQGQFLMKHKIQKLKFYRKYHAKQLVRVCLNITRSLK